MERCGLKERTHTRADVQAHVFMHTCHTWILTLVCVRIVHTDMHCYHRLLLYVLNLRMQRCNDRGALGMLHHQHVVIEL